MGALKTDLGIKTDNPRDRLGLQIRFVQHRDGSYMRVPSSALASVPHTFISQAWALRNLSLSLLETAILYRRNLPVGGMSQETL